MSRGLGDVYKRRETPAPDRALTGVLHSVCLIYTTDAADEEPCVDLGGGQKFEKIEVMELSNPPGKIASYEELGTQPSPKRIWMLIETAEDLLVD